MNKSKYEPPDYLAFYNAAFSAYAKTVLGANQLLLGYTVAATRTMLRATAFATPAAPATPTEVREPAEASVSMESFESAATSQAMPQVRDVEKSIEQEAPLVATDQQAELAQIEAALYADDTQPYSTESTAEESLTAEPFTAEQAVSEPIVTEPMAIEPQSRANRTKKDDARRRRGKK